MFRSCSILLMVLLTSFPSYAQTGRTIQEAEAIIDSVLLRVYALHEANFLDPKTISVGDHDYQPRHVYQLLRTSLHKISIIKALNGLESEDLPPFPDKEVNFDDVYLLAQKNYEDITKLLDIYDVYRIPEPTSSEEEITMHLLFQKAANIDILIDQIGLTPLFIKDIYHQGALVLQHIKEITKALEQGDTARTFTPTIAHEATTSKLYDSLYQTIENFKKHAEKNSKLHIPGGVLVRDKVTTPSLENVIELFYLMEADIMAMKVLLDLPPLSSPPTITSGMVPTDIDVEIQHISYFVNQL